MHQISDNSLRNDIDRSGGRDDFAVSPSGIFDHRPFFLSRQLLGPVFGVKRTDRLGGVLESGVFPVDNDLSDQSGHIPVYGFFAEFVDNGFFQHKSHTPLCHGVTDFERERGDLGHRFFHLDEQIPHLGSVAVDDDEVIPLFHHMNHETGRLPGVFHLLGLEPSLLI